MRVIGRLSPDLLFARHSRLAARHGLKGPKFILSFDCDTAQDIEVAQSVHKRLKELGVMAVWAVPGKLLEQGAPVYSTIAADGCEFINHGYFRHTYRHPESGRLLSPFSYHQLPWATLERDVLSGHDAVKAVAKRAPLGFRVPHFGSYQARAGRRRLYRLLAELGYRYSTSGTPRLGFMSGPVHPVSSGLWELPVSGCFDSPLSILDSYGFRVDPYRRLGDKEYVEQFRKAWRWFASVRRPGLFNIYADPSQIADFDGFFQCVEEAAPFALPSYLDLLRELRSP